MEIIFWLAIFMGMCQYLSKQIFIIYIYDIFTELYINVLYNESYNKLVSCVLV